MVHSLSFVFVLLTASVGWAAPSDSVVHIRRDVADGCNKGSGTVIAQEGELSLILTCSHVCPDGGLKLIVTCSGTEYEGKYLFGSKVTEAPHPTIPNAFTMTIDGPDLALLTVKAKLPVSELSKKPVVVGDEVRQWGYSGGKLENGPFGKFGTVTDADGIWSTADSRRGDSGCALFDKEGKVVGVVHSRALDPDLPGGLAVPLDEVTKFVKAKAAGFPKLQKSLK